MEDLFGNVIEEPENTFEEEYAEYIRSPKWRQKAKAALARAGEKCERCGYSKFSRRLEVHHRTYERFRDERPEDLEVVCEVCHREADAQRERRVAAEAHERFMEGPLVRGFEQFMFRGTRRRDWRSRMATVEIERHWEQFLDEIERQSGRRYYADCPFSRYDAW